MRNLLRVCSWMIVAVALAGGGGDVRAAGGGDSDDGSAAIEGALYEARRAIEVKKYRQAIPLLRQVVEAEPRNADAFNYLGYSHRQLGELKPALGYYRKALDIDPWHKGANEYLGELYLRMGDLGRAQERLVALAGICDAGCEEYAELKQKVEAFKKDGKAKNW